MRVPGDPGWYEVNLGTNAFGQGVAVTPIQMITAIAAVANHGKMMAPHVLKSVIENGEQYNNPPQVIGTPISAETADTLTEMLAISLEKESSDALVEGYRSRRQDRHGRNPRPGWLPQPAPPMPPLSVGVRWMIRASSSTSGWKNPDLTLGLGGRRPGLQRSG